MDETKCWFIHRLVDGTCEITKEPESQGADKTWGPFEAQGEAIARRVGLIRSGHCQPRLNPDVPQPKI
ncbi:MAG: hypothetical protein H7Y37_20090 [Anaerolineae bacterium]|nr:hypothetical protein [Gloeobacterales cyanobacterium ES-bin-313]